MEAKLAHYRLSESEYDRICELLGRPPQGLEWALFSALWSEHCSYKSSRRHLKKFYSQSARVLESFGENAGVIDLGEGERLAFKMESHNHPSYIEPYQGAATGVGGILRDIFTMGARPIALANYLCFGEASTTIMPHLVDGVVRGIAGYGNCVGVPTVTGQTEFHSSYNGNILVNAMAVGLFAPGDPVVTSKAQGVGNLVVYVGAKTGRDGVHGASMASESFAEDSEKKRPTVQIGDPFYEKLLIESCLEVIGRGLVVAIQDMGAAGLTSSSFEMAAKGGVGLKLFLDRVPLRQEDIGPEEILLSESQERMLLIAQPENLKAIQEVFFRWGLEAQVIGEVIEAKEVELFWGPECLVRIDPLLLTDNAPNYDRAHQPWHHPHRAESLNDLVASGPSLKSGDSAWVEELKGLLASVQGCSREWVHHQYDQRVGGRTAQDAHHSVASLRLADSDRALGFTLGLRPYLMRFDARQGAMDAVAYPALELASQGFLPLAMTDCLNFGNPENPKIMSEFVASIEGMSEVCRELDVPVISGNVSFYNETQGQNITSTPSTGLVGLRNKVTSGPQGRWRQASDEIYILSLPMLHCSGQWAEWAQSSASLKGWGEIQAEGVKGLIQVLLELSAWEEGVTALRPVGKMGLAYTLARMGLESDQALGAQVDLSNWTPQGCADLKGAQRFLALAFYETLYQMVVTVKPGRGDELEEKLGHWQQSLSSLEWAHLGQVEESGFLEIRDHAEVLRLSVDEMQDIWRNAWRNHFATLA